MKQAGSTLFCLSVCLSLFILHHVREFIKAKGKPVGRLLSSRLTPACFRGRHIRKLQHWIQSSGVESSAGWKLTAQENSSPHGHWESKRQGGAQSSPSMLIKCLSPKFPPPVNNNRSVTKSFSTCLQGHSNST